jgi:uncharacterized protein (DUF2141 family)
MRNKSAPTPSGTASLTIVISGFESDEGQALVAVYRSAEGFPDQPKRAVWNKAVRIRRGAVRITIEGLAPGPVAVAMMHDANKNFRLDTGLFGIPSEGYGASRDAPARFGPPKFKDAVFELKPGEHKQAAIRVRY